MISNSVRSSQGYSLEPKRKKAVATRRCGPLMMAASLDLNMAQEEEGEPGRGSIGSWRWRQHNVPEHARTEAKAGAVVSDGECLVLCSLRLAWLRAAYDSRLGDPDLHHQGSYQPRFSYSLSIFLLFLRFICGCFTSLFV